MPQITSTFPNLTRRQTLVAATILGLGATLAPGGTRAHVHQNANVPLAGTTVEQLSAGTSSLAPDRALVLLRVTMEAGTVIPPHSHPGPVALYVNAGTFGSEFFEGTGTVIHAAADGAPEEQVEMSAGDDVQMPVGDHLFYDGAVHTMRNDGDDVVELLVSALFDPESDGFQWANSATDPLYFGPRT